jgi:hypothetical protein
VTLKEVLNSVIDSQVPDWHVLEIHSGDEDHAFCATFKSDVSIAMRWGRSCNSDFSEDWTDKFLNKEAASQYVEIFFNGSPVFKDIYVSVDGDKGILPMPKLPSLEVPSRALYFAGLLHTLSRNQLFGYYVQLSGIKETDEPWPQI